MAADAPVSADPLSSAGLSAGSSPFSIWSGCGCCDNVVSCGTCEIPATNLTLTWHNNISDGTAVLVYTPPSIWISSCTGLTGQTTFRLLCNVGGIAEFQVIRYITGACPSGTPAACTTSGSNPNRIITNSRTCGAAFNWDMSITATSCVAEWANAYTGYTITYP